MHHAREALPSGVADNTIGYLVTAFVAPALRTIRCQDIESVTALAI